MPILLGFLGEGHSWATQTSAGDFLKAIITISANASQNEQSCIGPNELTRQLVSQQCIEKLIFDMLKGGNPLTVGVGIIIEVIRKNNSDYDPEVGAEANCPPSSRDPIYLGTLLRKFAQHVPDFMELILSQNHTVGGQNGPVTIQRKELNAAFGAKIEPLGFDRFKTCELMAEILHCSNMGLLNEPGSEEFVKARDIERERLKAEGKLALPLNDSTDDDLTMKSTRLGSPDGSRKLEVQNASDDDGFEEVTHLGDDSKDDFVELSSTPHFGPPVSFLDGEEFVDEPLGSPKLKPEQETMQFEDPEMVVEPLSPSKVLAEQVDSLGFASEDTAMTSPPPSVDTNTNSDSEGSDSNKRSPESSEESADSPPVVEAEKALEAAEHILAAPIESLPHPEDAPAPLSFKKPESSGDIDVEAPVIPTEGTTEAQDTTMAEANDSSNSVQTAQPTDDSINQAGEVVGDYLKMQFVEHKVVPTILVSHEPISRVRK